MTTETYGMERAIVITRRTIEDGLDNRAIVREDGIERETGLTTLRVLSGVNEFVTVTTDDGVTCDAWYHPNPGAMQEHVGTFSGADAAPRVIIEATARRWPGYGIA